MTLSHLRVFHNLHYAQLGAFFIDPFKNQKLNQNFVKFCARLMSAPASSVSLERIFSTFGYVRVYTKLRNRLQLKTTSKIVYFCYRHLGAKQTESESDSDSELN